MKHQCVINGSAKVGEPDEKTLEFLKALLQPGAVLIMSETMDKAAIISNSKDNSPRQLATLSRKQAELYNDLGWISCSQQGKISRYHLSAAIKQKLRSHYAQKENQAFEDLLASEEPKAGSKQSGQGKPRFSRMETPLSALARRKDKLGQPFLSKDLVRAGDRLREDFESAHIGPNICQNWNRLMTGPIKSTGSSSSKMSWSAEERVSAALAELGPGLGDVAVSCCCHLEGLETVEKKMGWSARSAKIVLKIALERLKSHYERVGDVGDMIG